MALLGKLKVPVIADTSPFSAGLARTSRLADSWSSRMGASFGALGSGLDGASKKVGGFAGALNRVSQVTRLSRNVLDVGEIGRAAAWSAVGVGRLRVAFMGSGDKAEALRARLNSTSAALRTMGRASERIRWKLLGADLGVFIARLGLLGGGAVGRAAAALGSIAMGALRMTGGLIRAGFATVGFLKDAKDAAKFTGHLVVNLAKAGAAFGGYALSLGKWSAASQLGFKSLGRAALSLVGVVQEGWGALSRLPSIAGGFTSVFRGATGAAGGVLRFGLALGSLGWATASGLARGFSTALGGVTRSIFSVTAGLAKLTALGGVVGLVFGVKAAASAARLAEVVNKTKEVFGEYADSVLKAAEASNQAYGTKIREFLDSSASIAGMLQGVGYSDADSAKLSTGLARLAKDMEEFREIPFEEALGKIQSGLAGQTQPLRSLGILIDETTVKTYAWTHGIAENGKELTNAQKVQARLALITQGLSKDQGALAREATGTSAQISEFNGRMRTLVDTIGETLSPVLGAALMEINTLIAAMTEAWKDSESGILDWFGVTAEALGGGAEGIGILQTSIGWLADAWSIVKGATAGFFSYFEAALSKVTGWLSTIFGALEKLGAGDWAKSTREFLEGYSEAAKQVSEDLWDSSQAAFAGDGIQSDKINEYFAKVREKIAAARAEMAEPLNFSASDPKGLEAPPKDSKERNPFGGAFELGSKGAAEIIARHRFGGLSESEKHAKATAENTAKLLEATRELNQALLGSPRLTVVGLS